jgi:hypothetical protein
MIVHEPCALDLDRGKKNCPPDLSGNKPAQNDHDEDFRVETRDSELYLVPKNGARRAVSQTFYPTEERCRSVPCEANPISVADLDRVGLVCFVTRQGRKGEITLTLPPYMSPGDDVGISFLTGKG